MPAPKVPRLRYLTRLRTVQSNERSRTTRRLEKALQDAGIKLSSVASTTCAQSARAMLEALLSGVTDPEQLAELSKGKMRANIPGAQTRAQEPLRESITGSWSRSCSRTSTRSTQGRRT